MSDETNRDRDRESRNDAEATNKNTGEDYDLGDTRSNEGALIKARQSMEDQLGEKIENAAIEDVYWLIMSYLKGLDIEIDENLKLEDKVYTKEKRMVYGEMRKLMEVYSKYHADNNLNMDQLPWVN